MKIVLTGATGFLGGHLLRSLVHENVHIIGRSKPEKILDAHFFRASIEKNIDFSNVLINAHVLIHCAARAHVIRDEESDPLAAYRAINVEGTINLATQAASMGVKRFIFISTVKVNGESTDKSIPLKPTDKPQPTDSYGISKLEAELGLQKIAAETNMEVVIIRPVLVYGPGVKANFYNMMKALSMGVPLPFGAIDNKRSLVYVDNLIDLIKVCIDHSSAANQIFFASDGEDLSTTDLLKRLGGALNLPVRLVSLPVVFFKFVSRMLGKEENFHRLASSLVVDISKNRDLLGWIPPVSVDDGLSKTAHYFLDRKNR